MRDEGRCPNCGHEPNDVTVNATVNALGDDWEISGSFPCPNCGTELSFFSSFGPMMLEDEE